MKPHYVITGSDPVPGTELVTVRFSDGPTREGLVTVHKSALGTEKLNDVIELQLTRQADIRAQLAAGGE